MREQLDAVVFDLDGTLVDSRTGIVAALDEALAAELGIREHVDWEIGPPLPEMIARALPALPPDRRDAVAERFREHYDGDGWRRTTIYDGIPELLDRLAHAGLDRYVVTNKRAVPTASILGMDGLAGRIRAAVSLDSCDPPHVDKAAALGSLLAERNLEPHRALYVGDTVADGRAAKEVRMPFVRVAWGYGPTEEPDAPVGTTIVSDVRDLLHFLNL